jgi:epoxyqueuosine reductase
MAHDWSLPQAAAIKDRIRQHGLGLGFGAVGFAAADLGEAEAGLADWLAAGCHGEMDYMARHGSKRARPTELLPGTRAVISVRLDYLPSATPHPRDAPDQAAISLYAQGRDYHKVLRQRLQRLADRVAADIGPFRYRAYTDSAPVMEVELARLAGLGWRGKHTLLLSRQGSWFFLGELYTDLPLPPDPPGHGHCGRCQACIEACPTRAILAPYRLDARRCISYLTIELAGAIPEEFRALLGNRIYGCDDCQLACPWNRFARISPEPDFAPRHGLDQARLVELFAWSESDFNDRLAGSPIRRIGFARWLRNLAVALGNAPPAAEVRLALAQRRDHPSALVREHVAWALARQGGIG